MKSIGAMALALTCAVALAGCGGGGGGSTPPTSPSNNTGSNGGGNNNSGGNTPASVAVSIKGDLGQASFVPNPVTVADGQVVVFKNTDSVTHHIMLNDGSMQTADIPPGATSATLAIGAANVGFHCTIHPDMAGAFNSGTIEMPPPGCQGAYCLGGGK